MILWLEGEKERRKERDRERGRRREGGGNKRDRERERARMISVQKMLRNLHAPTQKTNRANKQVQVHK